MSGADERQEPTGTLSQSEIDRLLGSAARVSGGAEPDAPPVQLYDFRNPHRVSKERLRTLEAMYERLVKSLESWVIGRIRGQLQMRLQSIEQFSFGEFTLSLPTPCATFICDVRDSGGQRAVVDVGQEFAFLLVDRLFGGTGQPFRPSRPLTRVERMALRPMVERMTQLIHEVWIDHIALELDIASFESFPDILLQTAGRDDPVLVANIEVTMADVSSMLIICLPFAVLDKFFTNSTKQRIGAATGSEHERAVNRVLVEQSLRAARVNVAARLPEFRMAMRDLASLTEGGIISTALPADSPIRVRIGAQERYIGRAGRVGQKMAVRVEGPVSEDMSLNDPLANTLSFDPSGIAEGAAATRITLD